MQFSNSGRKELHISKDERKKKRQTLYYNHLFLLPPFVHIYSEFKSNVLIFGSKYSKCLQTVCTHCVFCMYHHPPPAWHEAGTRWNTAWTRTAAELPDFLNLPRLVVSSTCDIWRCDCSFGQVPVATAHHLLDQQKINQNKSSFDEEYLQLHCSETLSVLIFTIWQTNYQGLSISI